MIFNYSSTRAVKTLVQVPRRVALLNGRSERCSLEFQNRCCRARSSSLRKHRLSEFRGDVQLGPRACGTRSSPRKIDVAHTHLADRCDQSHASCNLCVLHSVASATFEFSRAARFSSRRPVIQLSRIAGYGNDCRGAKYVIARYVSICALIQLPSIVLCCRVVHIGSYDS